MSESQSFANKTIAAELLEPLRDYIARNHPDSDLDFSMLEQASESFDDLENRIPLETASELFDKAAKLSGDDAIGITVGQTLAARHWGVLGYLLSSTPRGLEGIVTTQRFAGLLCDGLTMQFEMHNDLCSAGMTLSTPCSQHFSDFLVASAFSMANQISGINFPALEVKFQHGTPKNIQAFESFFRCQIYFDQPRTESVFDPRHLDLQSMDSDPKMRKLMEEKANTILAKLAPEDDLIESLRRYLIPLLSQVMPTLKEAGEHLNISPRSLQRRLAQGGSSYQAVIDELKSEAAKAYLAKQEYSFLDVALLLGFADQSSFNRAFKRWTGKTPTQFRKEL